MYDRTFFHVDEYGIFGPKAFPPVICLNRRTVLWSPAPMFVDAAHESGASIIGSVELLSLIEDRHVSVIARRHWFDRKWRNRDGAWSMIRWKDSFDSRLLAIATEDEQDPIFENRRVIIAPPETGFFQASEHLNKDSQMRDMLTGLYTRRRLPIGVLEKADRAAAEGRSVEEQILRDIHNHHNAVLESRSSSATVPNEFMRALLDLKDSAQMPLTTAISESSTDESLFHEALELLLAIRAPCNFSALMDFLESNQRSELISLLCSERAAGCLPDAIACKMARASGIKSLNEQIFSLRAPDAVARTIGSMIGTLLTLLTSNSSVGIVSTPVQLMRPWLQRKSLIPVDIDKTSKVTPFVQLALGTNRPTHLEIVSLLERMKRA